MNKEPKLIIYKFGSEELDWLHQQARGGAGYACSLEYSGHSYIVDHGQGYFTKNQFVYGKCSVAMEDIPKDCVMNMIKNGYAKRADPLVRIPELNDVLQTVLPKELAEPLIKDMPEPVAPESKEIPIITAKQDNSTGWAILGMIIGILVGAALMYAYMDYQRDMQEIQHISELKNVMNNAYSAAKYMCEGGRQLGRMGDM